MRTLYVSYPEWKSVTQAKGLKVYEQVLTTDSAHVWSGTSDFLFRSNVSSNDFADYSATFPSGRIAVASEDSAILGVVQEFLPNLIIPRTSDGKLLFSIWPTEGTRATLVTHSWTDKTTWYQKATRVSQEVPATVTSGTVYQLSHPYVVDAYHGKLWDEDNLKDSSNNSYRVAVEVNEGNGWAAKTEADPHDGVGDYLVSYVSGTITFDPAVDQAADVRVTYHYAESSEFVVKPTSGKLLKIRSVEVQFSTDVEMTDSVTFTAYGYVDVFAPQYLQANGGPYPPGTKIPLATTKYKTMYDFQAESNGALPSIPAVGGSTWRGIQNGIIVFPWDYAAMTPLSSAAGMEVRIKLEHDVPFNGEFGTATLYCLSEVEQ